MPDGISQPPFDARWLMLAVDANHADIMNHFDHDHDGVGSLNDLIIVVVKVVGHHGWTGSRAESDNASLCKGAHFHAVIAVEVAEKPRLALPRFRSGRRDLSVRRIYDQRSPLQAIHAGKLRTTIDE